LSLSARRIGEALAAGTPYADDLARAKNLAGSEPSFADPIGALGAGSDGGLASNVDLAAGYGDVIADLEEAVRVNSASGFLGRFMARIGSLVSVRRTSDAADPNDLTSDEDASPQDLLRGAQSVLDGTSVVGGAVGAPIAGALALIDRAVEELSDGDLPDAYTQWRVTADARAAADEAAAMLEAASLDGLGR
jgi:hypothetical protein